MPCRPLRLAALAIAGLLALTGHFLAAPFQPANAQTSRIVAVGDVHGAFDAFVRILQKAGIVDGQRRWAGGSTILVQTGDVFDRGTGVRDALDLLMQLESDARRAGGRVEALLGNHEIMNLLGEYRDVSPAQFAAFADGRSADRQRRAYDDYARIARRRARTDAAVQSREEWNKTHPPGFVEYAEALGVRGKYGRWLRSRAIVAVIDRTAFMHAGVNPAGAETLDAVNRTAAQELADWDRGKAAMVQAQLIPQVCTIGEAQETAVQEIERIAEALKTGAPPGDHVTREFVERLRAVIEIGKSSLLEPQGPLWFRGYAQWPDSEEPQMVALLQRLGVDRFVTGHTPSATGRIRNRFDNRAFLIDTGMLSSVFKSGRASALELRGPVVNAIYEDSQVPLTVPARLP
jgi:hypothetical protein